MKIKMVIFMVLIAMLLSLIMILSEGILAVAATPAPTFAPTPLYVDYVVNASAGPGGTISPSGGLFAYPGSSFTFNVTPNSGYKILDVSDNGISKGAIETYELWNVQTNHEVLATFSKITEAPADTSPPTAATAPSTLPGEPYNLIIVAVVVVALAAIIAAAAVVTTRKSK
jgi:hypothetical protein